MKKNELWSTCLVACMVLSIFLSGCNNSSGKINHIELSSSINKYYALEQQKDWEAVFDHRASEFIKLHEKSYFVSQMEADNKDWTLLKWEINSIKEISEERAVVSIDFLENVSEHIAEEFGVSGGNAISVTEDTVWLKENGRWLCRICGKRLHLTLNGDM